MLWYCEIPSDRFWAWDELHEKKTCKTPQTSTESLFRTKSFLIPDPSFPLQSSHKGAIHTYSRTLVSQCTILLIWLSYLLNFFASSFRLLKIRKKSTRRSKELANTLIEIFLLKFALLLRESHRLTMDYCWSQRNPRISIIRNERAYTRAGYDKAHLIPRPHICISISCNVSWVWTLQRHLPIFCNKHHNASRADKDRLIVVVLLWIPWAREAFKYS